MKNSPLQSVNATLTRRGAVVAAGALLLLVQAQVQPAAAQGTAFTYQGSLTDGANPANGKYDLRFVLYDSSAGGNQQGAILTNSATAVSNGLFTVTLDFSDQFPGAARWLEIAVRASGASTFSTLSPRQALTPAPYAITASTAASLTGVTENNSVSPGEFATVGGGAGNTANAYADTVGGGANNTASSPDGSATVGGGYFNTASADSSTVAGGDANIASGSYATVGGGTGNTASGSYATAGGGSGNTASGQYATVSGGNANLAAGDFSFAGGNGAQAMYQGDFVWADDNGGTFASTGADQFCVRALGGVVLAADVTLSGGNAYHNLSLSGGNALGYLYGSYPALADGVHLGYNWYYDANGNGHVSNTGGATSRLTTGYGFVGIYVGGVDAEPTTQRLLANSTGVTVNGTFNNSSDRNAKQDFAPVSPAQMLDKVAQLPVSEWSYKEDPQTRHVGPVAQDFYSVFNIGTDDKHIAPIDEGGVALAAIQGLNQKLTEKNADILQLKRQNDSLANRLKELEQLVQSLAETK